MLKAQATINGVISQQATMRTTRDSNPFIGFSVKLMIPGSRSDQPGKEVMVAITKDGTEEEAATYAVDTRIEAKGTLTFRKVNDALYLNFKAADVTLNPSDTEDAITGAIEFKGTVGKTVDERTDKKGNKFVMFSGFSTEKIAGKRVQSPNSLEALPSKSNLGEANVGDEFRYTWVRFVRFKYEREQWLQPKAKIEAKGEMSLTNFNGNVNIECRLTELQQQLPFAPSNPNEKVPF